jgi:Flp pilus assembly protein TadD
MSVYASLGQLYAGRQRLGEATAYFEKLAAARPKAVGPHTAVGVLMQLQNRLSEARAAYERALAIDANAAVAANNLAWLHVTTGGSLDVALHLALTAKVRLPDVPGVNDTLGFIYYKKGLHNFALPPLQAAVAGDARDASYRYHLGLAYAGLGDKARAREALQHALKLDPAFEGAADARATLARLVD